MITMVEDVKSQVIKRAFKAFLEDWVDDEQKYLHDFKPCLVPHGEKDYSFG